MGIRRQARETAMHVLYSIDICYKDPKEAKHVFLDKITNNDIKVFSNILIDGTVSHLKEIDKNISSIAKNWDLDRMASVDRAILRLATFEIMCLQETPIKVIINEAVEIAKKYSTRDSGKFVNGILDKLKILREPTNA